MTGNDTVHLDGTRKIQSTGFLKGRGVLVILSENDLGRSFILDKPVTVIGRDESCDIRIDDPLISKRHCSLSLKDGGHFQIEDLDSTNSTYLNGKVLKKSSPIVYADRIILGNTIMRFFHEEKFESK